jgi:hypothetical protein
MAALTYLGNTVFPNRIYKIELKDNYTARRRR